MSKFYCRDCQPKLDWSLDLPSTQALYQSDYQKGKYRKHTELSTGERLQSIFNDPSTTSIRQFVEDALLRGPMEIDDQNRVNFYATSTGPVGFLARWGVRVEKQDAVRVVKTSDPTLRH